MKTTITADGQFTCHRCGGLLPYHCGHDELREVACPACGTQHRIGTIGGDGGVARAPALQVKQLRPDAIIPRYMSAAAAGLDLAAAVDTPVVIAPGCWAVIPTGLAITVPLGHEAQVRPRSGLAANHGLTCLNAPGTIDADYRGEVKVILVNHGPSPFIVKHGERIAQLVIAPVTRAEILVVAELDETARGVGGFGSTGAV